MFIEPYNTQKKIGWIEVICGSMFSGKTEELIRRLFSARIANMKVEVFKPEIDARYDTHDIVSHDAARIHSTPISSPRDILLLSDNAEVVGIDEAQFFDESLPDVVGQLALKGIRVIVSGLDMDYAGRPFGPVPAMLALADYITKLHAICVRCGNKANYSYRLSAEEHTVLLGGKDHYEPRCRNCFSQHFT